MAKSIRAKMAKSGQNGQKCGIYTHPPPTNLLLENESETSDEKTREAMKTLSNKRFPPKNPVYPSPSTSPGKQIMLLYHSLGYPRGTYIHHSQVPGIDSWGGPDRPRPESSIYGEKGRFSSFWSIFTLFQGFGGFGGFWDQKRHFSG